MKYTWMGNGYSWDFFLVSTLMHVPCTPFGVVLCGTLRTVWAPPPPLSLPLVPRPSTPPGRPTPSC